MTNTTQLRGDSEGVCDGLGVVGSARRIDFGDRGQGARGEIGARTGTGKGQAGGRVQGNRQRKKSRVVVLNKAEFFKILKLLIASSLLKTSITKY